MRPRKEWFCLLVSSAIVLSGIFLVPGIGLTASEKTYSFSLILPPAHVGVKSAMMAAELVEKRTNGSVKFQVFHSGSLFNSEREQLEACQLGTLDFTSTEKAFVVPFSPPFGALDLPFIFRDSSHIWKVVEGPTGKRLMDGLPAVGLVGLGWIDFGFRNVTNSKRPVNAPDDLQGLKIRTMDNPVHLDVWKTLGANAVPMSWGEAVTALMQKTIDGQENPLQIPMLYKLWESQKYLSMTEHVYGFMIVTASKKTWDTISPEHQKVIKDAIGESTEFSKQYANDLNKSALEVLKEKGMQINFPDKKAFQEKAKAVYTKYESRYGKNVIEDIIKTK
jgi:TRAP-type transport system periplasmic protein